MNNYFNGKGTIGFTCDVCGRELNGCQIVNGMTFCAKCYQETFGKNNQQNEIQQLKQQIEEKDKQIDFISRENNSYKYNIDEQKRIIDNFAKQLKEKDKGIEKWHKLYKDKDNQFQSVRQRYHLINRLQASYDKKDKLHLSEMQCLELVEKNEQLQKNQKQLAIQELEKVKNKCDGMYELWINSNHKENMYNNEDIAGGFEDISVFTNDLIKKLKGK